MRQTLFALFIILTGCDLFVKPDTTKPVIVVAPESKANSIIKDTISPISLNSFKDIPKELNGCGCYFSESKEMFKKREYLFAADCDSAAVISVNNKLVKLRLVSSGREAGTFGDHDHTEIYTSNYYKVMVDIHYKHSIDNEVWWNDGTITIETKDGKKIVKNFAGECGC